LSHEPPDEEEGVGEIVGVDRFFDFEEKGALDLERDPENDTEAVLEEDGEIRELELVGEKEKLRVIEAEALVESVTELVRKLSLL
jgi:hypothetical protein